MFTGRVVQPGEPIFLPADTEKAIALAMEERDTCQMCGLPKAWCRDNSTGRERFDVATDFCWATYRLALRQEKDQKEGKHPSTTRATVLSVRFRDGKEPDLAAGLGIDMTEGAPGG